MANQFHRLQTQAELHRPERTGRGNPNDLTEFSSTSSYTIDPSISVSNSDLIFNPEDGQYYQDLNTGDVYRFVKFDDYTSEDSFVGDVSITKGDPESGQKTSILVTNTSVSTENSLSLTDLQKLKLISSDGGVQILTVDQDQTFTSSSFSIKVLPFTYEFNIGSFYGITAEVRQATTGAYWEKLIEYDRDSQKITNVVLKADSDAIGEVTVAFGGEEVVQSETGGGVFFRYNGENYSSREDAEKEALSDGLMENEAEKAWRRIVVEPETVFKRIPRDVQTVTANLFAQVTEGEEITIFNPETAESIKLTINDDGNDEITAFGPGENVVLDVQDDKTNKRFPVGSLIFAEEGFRESSIKVDPSRIQLAVLGARGGDGIGVLTQDVGVGTTTQLSLNRIDDTVNLKDNQALILTNKFGDVKQFTVDGDQVLSVGSDTVNVNNIIIAAGEPIFEAGTATVKEPSYSTSSRITVQEDSITSAVNLATDAVNATNSIEQRVSSTESSISSLTTFTNGINNTLASTTQKANANESSISSLTTFTNSVNSSLASTTQLANNNGALVQSSVQFNEDAQGEISLFAGPNGSEITLTADTISLNDIDVIKDDGSGFGVIKTSTFNATEGWKISGTGEAFFKKITLGDIGSNRFVTLDTDLGELDINVGIADVYDELNVRPEPGGISTDLNFYRNDSGNEYLTMVMSTFTSVINSIEVTRGSNNVNKRLQLRAIDSFNGVTNGVFTLFPDPAGSGPVAGATIQPRLAIGVVDTNDYSGALYINGDVRWDGTTSSSANKGSNNDVPTEVEGYLLVNISGTNYKIPYYNT